MPLLETTVLTLFRKLALTIGTAACVINLNILKATADDWVRIYTNRTQNYVIYLHKTTIVRNGPIRYFWVHLTRADGLPVATSGGRRISGMNLYYSADCQKRVVRLRTMEIYDDNGRLVDQQNLGDTGFVDQMTTDTPETKGITNYVCGKR